ncbi:MAG: tyrosine-type recombinase/integrase [Candidatus Omnitrophota bacterium]|nr:tyrosine-type recombinase/integrase [Candidatus Omnitrophota bacterium]
MATKKLTKTVVEAEASGDRDVYLWDSVLPRFGVRITSAGARIYLVQYRARPAPGEPPRTRRISIGQHGELWKIDDARAEAKRLLALVDLGRDPFADREAEREAEHQAKLAAQEAAAAHAREAERRETESFAAVAELFIERKAKKNRTWAETERLLRFGLGPAQDGKRASGHRTKLDAAPGPIKAWGKRHVSEIRRGDVAELLESIGQRSPAVARATFAALRPLFDWCVERDLMAVSPCDKLTAPPRSKARDRVLSDSELHIIWQASERLGYPFGPVVQLLMLTGQRRSEVAGMTWAEVDLDAGRWRIPAERTKNGKAHEVDLSPQAVAVLKKIAITSAHVFPARGEGAVRGFSATKRRLDELTAEIVAEDEGSEAPSPWRLHDLRRTAATGMAALAFPPHVVERVLNHISGTQSGLVGVYQRHEYRPEREAALKAWGQNVAAIVSGQPRPSNVVGIRR